MSSRCDLTIEKGMSTYVTYVVWIFSLQSMIDMSLFMIVVMMMIYGGLDVVIVGSIPSEGVR